MVNCLQKEIWVVCGLLLLLVQQAAAQDIRFPTAVDPRFQGGVSPPAVGIDPRFGPAQPPAITGSGVPGANLGTPGFDPYSSGASSVPPSLPLPFGGSPAANGGGFAFPPTPQGGPVPPDAYPGAAPNALFPNGIGTPWGNGGVSPNAPWGPPLRLVYGPRIRHAWLGGGDDGSSLGINDSDVSIALAPIPSFFNSGQPLFVLPSFSMHLWDGPKPPNPADLPATAYSTFLDFGWRSNVDQQIGAELGLRAGLFTDFQTITSDSFRILGQGLFRLRLTPTISVRAGVLYADRADIKILPVGGVLWEPNELTRFDIYFPQPKLSQYLSTIGNQAIWWYVGGEWGGGSWTVERADGSSDRIDINDIRLFGGLEWGPPARMAAGRRVAFVEAGWVFDREVVYVVDPSDTFSPDDTFMIRGGIGY